MISGPAARLVSDDEGCLAVDTSVAVPLLVVAHPDHQVVFDWARGRRLVLCGHAVAETYSVLTRLSGGSSVEPDVARDAISRGFHGTVALEADAARTVHQALAEAGVAGGAVYDALVAMAAIAHSLPLATRDARARNTYEAIGVRVELVTRA